MLEGAEGAAPRKALTARRFGGGGFGFDCAFDD
jgi:hypothetical protein